MEQATTISAASPSRGMRTPLRSRLTLVVVPFSALTVACMLVAVLEPSLQLALTWFRSGLTAATIGTCVTVVVIVLDKHRWAREAFAEAVAEAALSRNRVIEATVKFEIELTQARLEVTRELGEVVRGIAEGAAFEAVASRAFQVPARLTLHAGDSPPIGEG